MANVKLSAAEINLACDASVILTKQKIIAYVYDLFFELSKQYRAYTALSPEAWPKEAVLIRPKIAKGEQYEQLPWVMLDYPALFGKEDIFAVRTFFWWGNFCSITIQLHGQYMHRYGKALLTGLQNQDWQICIQPTAWEHHFRSDNYRPLHWLDIEQDWPFVKLATKIPLHEWDCIETFFSARFEQLHQALAANAV